MIIELSKKLKKQKECLNQQTKMDIEGFGINDDLILYAINNLFGLDDIEWSLK